MKVAALSLTLIAGATAFSQPDVSRREAGAAIAAAGAAFLPVAANAAAGESPRFSVFGVIGDGTSYSEGAAYGSDQSAQTYSPYSVYGNGKDAIYDPATPEYAARKKAVLAESATRLTKLSKYIERKEWFNVTTELDRYMYETRNAVRGLATTDAQKSAATDFFKAIEKTDISARLKKQEACFAAAADAQAKLDAFVSTL
mmetsp:Transcript_23751/g.33202  ORF Transcript_23751/g.33202 Transcript_23751/m.33202 type:complete len:200 (+) Transcript_23751:70-669(+)